MKNIRAILFDKDGTLFDFQATWGAWARRLIAELAEGQPKTAQALADAMDYDVENGRFRPGSAVIASTGREVAELLAPALPGRDVDALEAWIAVAAAEAPLAEAVPLRALLEELRRHGYRLGVATNDFESVARRHVAPLADLIDFVAGFDSGHGGKPAPRMLLAFARSCDLAPDQVLMVGDSRHDLIAGRAAGMATLGVLTGVALAEDLAPLADLVRPDIGHLPQILGLD